MAVRINRLRTWPLAAIIALCSCSSSSNRASLAPQGDQDPGRFKVSVVSDGQKVKDFGHDLVHRVSLPPATVDQMISGWPAALQRLGTIRNEYDSHGQFMGLRVIGSGGLGSQVPVLSLVDRDVITAVGIVKVRGENDLLTLFKELKKSGYATMTIERSGTPHKYLYYSKSSAAAAPRQQ